MTAHPERKRVPEEWRATYKLELKPQMCLFAKTMVEKFGEAVVLKAPLSSLGAYVRKIRNTPDLDAAFLATFRALASFGQRRGRTGASCDTFE